MSPRTDWVSTWRSLFFLNNKLLRFFLNPHLLTALLVQTCHLFQYMLKTDFAPSPSLSISFPPIVSNDIDGLVLFKLPLSLSYWMTATDRLHSLSRDNWTIFVERQMLAFKLSKKGRGVCSSGHAICIEYWCEFWLRSCPINIKKTRYIKGI